MNCNKVYELRDQGYTIPQICEMMGYQQCHVTNLLKPSLQERLENRVKVNEETGCWEYQGLRQSNGYGMIKVNRKNVNTHRVAYQIYKGEIADGLQVCHICDNPACFNPDHLFLGTAKDNMQDKIRKGRHRAGNPIPEDIKNQIKQLSMSGISKPKIAELTGVAIDSVRRILRNSVIRL